MKYVLMHKDNGRLFAVRGAILVFESLATAESELQYGLTDGQREQWAIHYASVEVGRPADRKDRET